jgi:very-short-patch-repair endonuclease
MRDQKTENSVRRQLQLEQYAWLNRRALTASEARLWSALSARRLGVQFRRQVPLAGRFIVDFAAPSAGLIVEVDGVGHAHRRGADKRRDRALTALGWRVLRLDAALVISDLPAAVALVQQALV